MKLVHAADIHLDSPMRGLDRYEGAPLEAMRGATRRALSNLVDLCLDEQASLLVVAGDVFDGTWKDFGTGLTFVKEMARLRAAQIPVVLLRGNHDAQSQITANLKLPDNVRELSSKRPETFEIPRIGVAVHGQGFATRAVTDDLAARYPDARAGLFNVGVLHTCVEGREGHDAYAPTSLKVLASKGYDYWALGHVHQREVLSRDPWVVFPGNLQGRHVRESGAKGATVVETEGGRVARVAHRPLDVARWCTITLDAEAASSADDVVDLVRPALLREQAAADGRILAARVLVRGATSAHVALQAEPDRYVAEVRAAANDVGGVWVEKVRFETRTPLDLARMREREGAVGELARSLHALRSDPEGLAELLAELKDLRAKLPPEVREGDGALRLDDPETLVPVLDDVEQILFARLAFGEEDA